MILPYPKFLLGSIPTPWSPSWRELRVGQGHPQHLFRPSSAPQSASLSCRGAIAVPALCQPGLRGWQPCHTHTQTDRQSDTSFPLCFYVNSPDTRSLYLPWNVLECPLHAGYKNPGKQRGQGQSLEQSLANSLEQSCTDSLDWSWAEHWDQSWADSLDLSSTRPWDQCWTNPLGPGSAKPWDLSWAHAPIQAQPSSGIRDGPSPQIPSPGIRAGASPQTQAQPWGAVHAERSLLSNLSWS